MDKRFICLYLFFIASTKGANIFDWHEQYGIEEAENIKIFEENEISEQLSTKPIIGGTTSSIHSHPYLAGIVIDLIGTSRKSACGGSLITPRRVLTAAHCWFDGRSQAWQFTVVLGSQYLYLGGTRIQTKIVLMHPQYDPHVIANDIAMVHLPILVRYSQSIQPVALPGSSLQANLFVNVWTQASGFGRHKDNINPSQQATIRAVFLKVITNNQCRIGFGHFIRDSNICTSGAGGVGICHGDSGGPLTVNANGQKVLIGISSFVSRDDCQLGYPSVFVRITSFMDWILSHT